MTEPVPAMPKLIFITHEFAPFRGGVATYVEEVTRALHRQGAQVEVWAPDHETSHRVKPPCPLVRLRAGGSLKWHHLAQLSRELAARRDQWADATVVLASVGAHLAFLRLAATGRVRAKRLISLLHGSEVLRFGRNPLWRWLARRLYREVQAVATVSEFSRSLIEESFLAPFAKEIVIAPVASSSDAARIVPTKKRLDDQLRVLTLARVHPRKGQLDTARALGQLPKELRQRVIYQIGGTGDAGYLRKVAQTCAETGMAWEQLGEVKPEALAEVYAQCDIYAMTSRRLPRSVEGFGITYLDAGFHAKPVVAYRSGGAGEAVRDGETGLLVPEGDTNALTGAFARLLADAELRERLGKNGQQRAQALSWNTAAKVFLRAAAD